MLAVLALPLELLKSFKIAVVLSAFSGDNPGFGRGNLADSGLKGQESAKLPALGTAIGRRERRLPGGNANQSAKRFGSGGRESGLLPLDRSVRPRGLGRALYRVAIRRHRGLQQPGGLTGWLARHPGRSTRAGSLPGS